MLFGYAADIMYIFLRNKSRMRALQLSFLDDRGQMLANALLVVEDCLIEPPRDTTFVRYIEHYLKELTVAGILAQ